MEKLKVEYEFYLKNQLKLVQEFDGKYLVIKGGVVCGAYNSITEAINYARSELGFKLGDFLVQKCSAGNVDTVQHFHSRVAFTHAY